MKKFLTLFTTGLLASGAAMAQSTTNPNAPYIIETEGLGRYGFIDKDITLDARLDRNTHGNVRYLYLRMWVDPEVAPAEEVLIPTIDADPLTPYDGWQCGGFNDQNRVTEAFGAGTGTPGTDNYIFADIWDVGTTVYASVKARYCNTNITNVFYNEQRLDIVDIRSIFRNSLGAVVNNGTCNLQVVGSFSIAASLDGTKALRLDDVNFKLDDLFSTATEADFGGTLYLYHEPFSPTATFDGTESFVEVSGVGTDPNTFTSSPTDGIFIGNNLNISLSQRQQFYLVACITPALEGKVTVFNINANDVWMSYPALGIPTQQVRVPLTAISTELTLPVDFLSVKADIINPSTAKISWNVANEVRIARYELQKATNGVNFETIATVPPTAASSYFALDNNLKDLNYYRIKAIDLDGRFGYSETLLLNTRNASTAPYIAGNPVVNNTIRIMNTKAGSKISIVENTGRTLMTWTATNVFETKDINRLPAGNYIVVINDNGKVRSIKFNKQ